MPLFVVISGYFFNPYQNINKLKTSSIKLIETFFIYFLIYECLKWVQNGSLTIKDLISPPYIMWYLWTLIFWRITGYHVFNRYKCNKTSIFLAFGAALTIGLLPIGNELAIQRFFAFAFFFVIGIYMRNNRIKPNKFLLISSIPVLFTLCYLLIKLEGRNIDDLRFFFYYNRPYETAYDTLIRVTALILGLSISVFLWNTLKEIRIIAKIGASTLPIYLLHLLPIKFYKYYSDIYHLPQDIISLLLLSISIVCSIYLISRKKHFDIILNPFSHRIHLR